MSNFASSLSLRLAAIFLAVLLVARPSAAQSTQAVLTQGGSGIAIQVTNLYNGVPTRGFLPVRVNITNSSNSDGQWVVETQATYGPGNDRHFGAKATCAVPAQGTRMIEVLAPLPDTDNGDTPPHVVVHVTGPGVVNPDVTFVSNIQQVPRSALQVSVPLTTTTYTVRGGVPIRPGIATSISTDALGNSTRTTVTTRSDGSTSTEVLITRPDGSTQTTVTEADISGRIIARGVTRNTPPNKGAAAAPDPASSIPTIVRNADGSTTLTTVTTQADGSKRTEVKTTKADGSVSTTFTVRNPAGVIIDKGGTDSGTTPSSTTPTPAPVPAPSSGTTPPPTGASAPISLPVGRVGTVASNGIIAGNTTLASVSGGTTSGAVLSVSGWPIESPAAAGSRTTSYSTDALSGAPVRTSVTKNADGSLTTTTTTASKMGFDIVTVTTDAAGHIKSSSHELSLSPEMMGTVVAGGNTGRPGAVQAVNYSFGDEKVLLASVAAAVQPITPAAPATTFSTSTLASRPPPPPPPPPPPAPISAPSVRAGSGSRGFTGTATFSSSPGTTIIRGGRGATYRSYSRSPGVPIFIGLSSTLAHDVGEKIKTYFNNICVRPIQQSTLDPTAMSADWRAYLGFDLVFFTATDWLAAPPEVRLALIQWVAAGGELRLISKQDGGLNLPPLINEHYGAGSIELFTEDDLANYNFTLEYTDAKERALFSLEYHPVNTLTASPENQGYDVPSGMQVRVFTMSADTLFRITGLDPLAGMAVVADPNSANIQNSLERMLTDNFTRNGSSFGGGASLHLDVINHRLVVINTAYALDQIAQTVSRYGESVVAPVASGQPPAATSPSSAITPGAPAGEVKKNAEPPQFIDQMPHLSNRYFLVAGVIICFGLLVGPLNLFWFCRGARRPHLLWVTPLLAIAASVAILAFILLAEGIGGRGVYYRITQLNPDGKFAVESEVESSVTGVLTHRDFDLGELAWVLDYNQAEPGPPMWDQGSFVQTGKHYSGDWFASRREQMLVARAVVPTRASLRAEAVEGKPPVLHSEYNGLMVNLFYEDGNGRYWKIDRMTDGQPTHLQPATEEEFKAAWDENVRNVPKQLAGYLHKVTPVPGTFFALGSGEASPLEPDFTGLRWNRFRHLITGPVL